MQHKTKWYEQNIKNNRHSNTFSDCINTFNKVDSNDIFNCNKHKQYAYLINLAICFAFFKLAAALTPDVALEDIIPKRRNHLSTS